MIWSPLAAETVNLPKLHLKTADNAEMSDDGGSISTEHNTKQIIVLLYFTIYCAFTINMRYGYS